MFVRRWVARNIPCCSSAVINLVYMVLFIYYALNVIKSFIHFSLIPILYCLSAVYDIILFTFHIISNIILLHHLPPYSLLCAILIILMMFSMRAFTAHNYIVIYIRTNMIKQKSSSSLGNSFYLLTCRPRLK